MLGIISMEAKTTFLRPLNLLIQCRDLRQSSICRDLKNNRDKILPCRFTLQKGNSWLENIYSFH